MKLIYIAPMLHPVGGLERTLTDKANRLVAEGHDVMLLTYKQGQEKIFYPVDSRVRHLDIDCPVFSIYRLPVYARLGRYLQLRRQFRQRLATVLADFRPDVMVITVPNTEDFIHDMVAVAGGVKVVVECHLAAAFHLEGKPSTERLLCRLFPPVKAIRKADLLITLTQRDADYWRQRGMARMTVVPNPVTFYPDVLPAAEKVPGRIIAVGRLFAQKRFDRLIDAFAQLAPKYAGWTVDIYGEGPLRTDLQSQIDRLGLTARIRLQAPSAHIMDAYQRSQFFVLSSDYEGFGLVVVEAMACGLPVVATDCPCGPSELVHDGVTGLLAKMDVADLAAKMEWMMAHDQERQAMGRQAYAAAARYRLERVMKEWEQAYASVL